MPARRTERRLTAILAADAAGYSRMLAEDEAATLALFQAHLATLRQKLRKHGGRLVKTMGDGVLAEFPSSLEALVCAVEFQQATAERNKEAAPPQRMVFRIGVHAGDALVRDGDVFGDAVVLASRLQTLAPPGAICVSARVREDSQGRSNLLFDDQGDQTLKNIDRPVRVYSVRLDGAPAHLAHALLGKPSIAVLPFANMSGDPDQEYFADGLTEDVISALSRWRWFFVIARNSTFTYKGRAVDVTQVGRELGVRYVLEGSVRKAGSRVRVVAQLIDATDGSHVWADTFDRDIADLFALQDEITEHVVNAIEPAMLQSEGERAAKRNIQDLSAFDCYQRGMWRLHQVSAESSREAEALFREAIRRDPDLAHAHVGLSRILYGKVIYGWSEDEDRDIADSFAAAQTAVSLDTRDFWAHFALAGALLFMGRHDEALQEASTAVALNPNSALGYSRLGQALVYAGRAREAIEPIERSMRHNPFDPQIGPLYTLLSLAHYHAGNYEDAARHAQTAVRHKELRAAGIQGASLARLGRLDEARRVFSPEIQARASQSVRRLVPYARPEDFMDLLEGLRLAGLGQPYVEQLGDKHEPG